MKAARRQAVFVAHARASTYLPHIGDCRSAQFIVGIAEAWAGIEDLGLSFRTGITCKSLLEGSEKAAAQWELERRFQEFEAKF
jgi:hypothetical protein